MCDLPDATPNAYARWRATELGAATERLERALIPAHIGNAAVRGVLDVVCGDGDLDVQLAKAGRVYQGLTLLRL